MYKHNKSQVSHHKVVGITHETVKNFKSAVRLAMEGQCDLAVPLLKLYEINSPNDVVEAYAHLTICVYCPKHVKNPKTCYDALSVLLHSGYLTTDQYKELKKKLDENFRQGSILKKRV